MIRAVLDANIYVSAAIVRGGAPDRIVRAWRENKLIVVSFPTIVEEVADALHRPHICRRYKMTEQNVKRFLRVLRSYAMIVPGQSEIAVVRQDPDDDAIIAAALEGKADYIVTGDSDLLDIKEHAGIRIVTPARFWRILAA